MPAQLFWNAANLWPLAVAVGLGVVALVVWLYPVQTRGLSRPFQVILPLLRVLAIVALVLSLLKPTLLRPATQQENGAIVVLVDRSASMGVSDSELTPADRVAIADGLGIIAEKRRKHIAPEASAALALLQRGLDRLSRAGGDLEYARLSGRQVTQRQAELDEAFTQARQQAAALWQPLASLPLEASIKDKAKVLADTPNAQQRQAWLGNVGEAVTQIGQVLQKQQADADTQFYNSDADIRQACNALASESRLRLVEQALVNERTGLLGKLPADVPLFGFGIAEDIRPLPLRSGTTPVKRLLVDADGQQTRLGAGVLGSMESLKGRTVRAVVLISDGRPCGEVTTPEQLAISSVPIYTVAVGRENSVKDLSIANVKMPSSAFVGETVTVQASLKSTNMPAGDYELQFRAGETQLSKKVHLEPNGTGDAEFQYKAQKAGVDTVTLQAKGSDAEATQKNNAFSRPVKIVQDKVNVLLLASRPGWDYQYVRNSLMRTPWARVSDVVLDDPKAQFSLDPQRIAQQNVICLFHLRGQAFTSAQVDAVHQAVSQKGASVILVASDPSDLESWSQNILLGEMLPYRPGGKPVWRSWPGDRAAFHIGPSEASQRMEVLRLSDDFESSRARWTNLPAVYHYLAVPQLKPNVVHTLLIEKDSLSPVLIESRLGSGRVFFMGLDETWRWRLRVGERDQDRFWTQLIRYSADEPYALVGEKLSLDLETVSVRPGDTVKVRVRVTAKDDGAQSPVIEVKQGGKVVQDIRPSVVGDLQQGRYEATLHDLPPGAYDISARLTGDKDGASALHMPLDAGYGLQQELADVSADPGTLRQIAAATGGQMYRIEQLGDLPQRLQNLRGRTGSMTETPLWSSAYLFLVVLGCFTTEWAIRKRVGLA